MRDPVPTKNMGTVSAATTGNVVIPQSFADDHLATALSSLDKFGTLV